MILYVVNLLATFGVFSVVCLRLYEADRPGRRNVASITRWWTWLAVHISIVITMLVMLAQEDARHMAPSTHVVLLKCVLAVLLLEPWLRRENDR